MVEAVQKSSNALGPLVVQRFERLDWLDRFERALA
jgi:hypothetical protein